MTNHTAFDGAWLKSRLVQVRLRGEAHPYDVGKDGVQRYFRLQEECALVAKARKLGVLVRVSDEEYKAPSPSLLAIAEEAVKRGISLHSALSLLEEIERHCDSVSRAFVKLFLREVWKPFAQADMPAERWPEMEAAVERLRPVASEALMAIFQQRLGAQVEEAFSEIARRLPDRER